ncbi:hypothetical protein PGT21_011235 [Puccinia graminis f. sp. tritici]|uniref:Secreted protein n=1 Tax=Puccinia graminis f. sp. tritici TaxID=56615 RepID=A0A5B0LK74_PUCGR|nr:hypothetical protein PGT21_011235 [Puccinia graminis f. sp. tritici]
MKIRSKQPFFCICLRALGVVHLSLSSKVCAVPPPRRTSTISLIIPLVARQMNDHSGPCHAMMCDSSGEQCKQEHSDHEVFQQIDDVFLGSQD